MVHQTYKNAACLAVPDAKQQRRGRADKLNTARPPGAAGGFLRYSSIYTLYSTAAVSKRLTARVVPSHYTQYWYHGVIRPPPRVRILSSSPTAAVYNNSTPHSIHSPYEYPGSIHRVCPQKARSHGKKTATEQKQATQKQKNASPQKNKNPSSSPFSAEKTPAS